MREEDLGESWPEIPEWATVDELAPDVLRDLRGLSKEGAEFVALHLVAAGTLAEEEPELAWRHARAARSKGGRIAVVRETVGLVAYRAGEWSETIAELRAARRMGGGPGHLAVMADSERALGNPEKAIEMSRSAEAAELDDDGKLELTIVVAGARADLGQIDTALVVLEGSGVLEDDADARLLYAYADLLAAAKRTEEALDWFMKAHDADEDDETDAAERIAELAAGDDDDEDDDDDDDDGNDDDAEDDSDEESGDVADDSDVAEDDEPEEADESDDSGVARVIEPGDAESHSVEAELESESESDNVIAEVPENAGSEGASIQEDDACQNGAPTDDVADDDVVEQEVVEDDGAEDDGAHHGGDITGDDDLSIDGVISDDLSTDGVISDGGISDRDISDGDISEGDISDGADESDQELEPAVDDTSEQHEQSAPPVSVDLPLFSDDLFSDQRDDTRDPNERR